MCACILHSLFIDHAISQDWMEENMQTEDDEELEQHNNERANQHDQILVYMMEIC